MTSASNSQVMTLLTCETQWKYAHHPAYNYEPRTLGPALTRGLIGHKALEFYYSEIFNGAEREATAKATVNRLMERSLEFMSDPDKSQMYLDLAGLLRQYFDFYDDEFGYLGILGVEILLEIPRWDFVGRADVVFRDKRTGKIVPYDHKFVYNFWPEVAVQINAQLPNYILALRHMFPGEVIDHAIANEIRHRGDAVDRFERVSITPTDIEMMNIIDNHRKGAARIERYKAMSREEIDVEALRTMTKFNCEYCHFWLLCKNQLQKNDTELLEVMSFASNSYGYEDKND